MTDTVVLIRCGSLLLIIILTIHNFFFKFVWMSAYNNAYIYVFIYVRHWLAAVPRFLCNQNLTDGNGALCPGTNVQSWHFGCGHLGLYHKCTAQTNKRKYRWEKRKQWERKTLQTDNHYSLYFCFLSDFASYTQQRKNSPKWNHTMHTAFFFFFFTHFINMFYFTQPLQNIIISTYNHYKIINEIFYAYSLLLAL